MDKINTVRSYSSLKQHCVLINHCKVFEKILTSQEHKNKKLEEKVNELEEKRKWMGRETVSRPPPSPALRQLHVHKVARAQTTLQHLT